MPGMEGALGAFQLSLADRLTQGPDVGMGLGPAADMFGPGVRGPGVRGPGVRGPGVRARGPLGQRTRRGRVNALDLRSYVRVDIEGEAYQFTPLRQEAEQADKKPAAPKRGQPARPQPAGPRR